MTNDIIAAFRSVFAGSGDFRSCNVSCNNYIWILIPFVLDYAAKISNYCDITKIFAPYFSNRCEGVAPQSLT